MDFANFALGAGGVLVGTGVSWGYLKNEVKNLRRELNESKRVNEDQENKISFLRDRGINLMFKTDCGDLREECQSRICAQFAEVKREIVENREASAAMNKEISLFMGYVKATLEELKRK